MRTFVPLLALLAVACTGTDDTDLAPATPVDPDVASWSPPSFPPAQVDRLVFLGDSISVGYGVNVSANHYMDLLESNNDNRWPGFADDDITNRYGAIEQISVARSGAETPDLLSSQIPNLQAQGPFTGHTAAFITIGGNDLVGALATPGALDGIPALVEQNIEDTVIALKNTFPDGVSIHITNVYEPTDGAGQANDCFLGLPLTAAEPVLDDTNARTLDLAQQYDFAWVDLRGHFLGHGHNHDRETIDAYHPDDPTIWLQDDCIHPNARGHHEIRRLFLAALDNEPLSLWRPDE